MSRHSEEILLQVPYVRHKKNDGTLYLMAERCGWMMKSKDNFHVNYKYTDIKSQKISPEGKAKIQLQIVLHDGSSTTFHFVHPKGQEEQMRERDAIKEMLQQLLPKFKKKVNKELEERHRLLSDNPGLLQLYKDLVITQIQTAEEFWAQHAASVVSKSKQLAQKQEVGVSGSFLADIKPQADGANGLKYNLTADIRESIFKTYPAVKKKHLENVPHKMSEQDFWTKFFQSHYFHRDRIHGHGIKDIFTECAKDDDRTIREQLRSGVSDRVANISGFSDKTLDENYGGSEGDVASTRSNAVNIVHQNIIKRFNQHSIMVMKATDNIAVQHQARHLENGKDVGRNQQPSTSAAAVLSSDVESSRKRLHDKLCYEDLEAPAPKRAPTLNLAKVERYLTGPTPANSAEYLTFDDMSKARTALRQELFAWGQKRDGGVLTANNAVSALVDLSPGGTLMQSGRQDALADQCPETVQKELAKLYGSLSELSRHFWACFPPTNVQLQDKANKMFETLKKFQQVKLMPFENELKRNYTSMSSHLTSHLGQILEAAFRKYASWRQKKLPAIR